MNQTPVRPGASNHGNKYVTLALLLLLVAGLFVATITHLAL